MTEARFVAYCGVVVASFVWMQWKRTSTRKTRAFGVVAIVAAFLVFSWLYH